MKSRLRRLEGRLNVDERAGCPRCLEANRVRYVESEEEADAIPNCPIHGPPPPGQIRFIIVRTIDHRPEGERLRE